MSTATASVNPYAHFEGTPQWKALDRALRVLADKQELVEASRHEYIVGYLCQSLEQPEPRVTLEQRLAALERIRAEIARSPLAGRDLVQELIDERRAEAASEEFGL